MGLQRDFEHFIVFACTFMVQSTVSTSIGILIGTLITNHSTATLASNAILAPFIMFGGLSVNFDSMYVWIRWLQYVSPVRYSLEACLRNEFDDQDVEFDPVEAYNLNTSISTCFIVLISMTIVVRALAILAMKLTAKR